MAVTVIKAEVSNRGIEIEYSDGTKEEIEGNRYERKNANGRTVEERPATDEDRRRLAELADGSGISTREYLLDDGTKVEVGENTIEVEFPDGTKEEIENGRYERKDASGETVEERPATDEDRARLEAFVPGGSTSGGDDTMPGGGDDTVPGGGDDTVPGGGDDTVPGGGDDTVPGGDDSRNDDEVGGDGEDRMRGRKGDDSLDGGDGDDRVRGDGGNDTLEGGSGDDRVRGGRDDDTVRGGDGNDRVRGDQGDDLVEGGAGRDRVKGGSGNDTVDGGSGDDRLWGNLGDDLFVFQPGSGADKIHDFRPGEDRIDISAFGFADFDAVLDATSPTGSNDLLIDLGDGDSIRLSNLSETDLSGSDFDL